MQVFLKNLSGRTITIDVDPEETVGTLKLKIQDADGTPPEQQRIKFNGRGLELDSTLLSAYGIEKESTLHLVLLLRGGMFDKSSGRDGKVGYSF